MTSQLLESAVSHNGFTPLPGRCIVKFDEIPTMAGLLHIPDSARRIGLEVHRDVVRGEVAYSGEVLAMTPRKNKSGELVPELFNVGDRVWVMLMSEDLEERVVCTRIERVYAVLEN